MLLNTLETLILSLILSHICGSDFFTVPFICIDKSLYTNKNALIRKEFL